MVKLYFRLWALGALLSGIAHLAAPEFMAAGTSWPLAYGWQREIALFDIMLALYISVEVKYVPEDHLGALLVALASLSLGLGINHLLSAIHVRWSYVHVAGCIANAIAVVFGLFLFVSGRLAFRKIDA